MDTFRPRKQEQRHVPGSRSGFFAAFCGGARGKFRTVARDADRFVRVEGRRHNDVRTRPDGRPSAHQAGEGREAGGLVPERFGRSCADREQELDKVVPDPACAAWADLHDASKGGFFVSGDILS
jgi:hypothetical protein